MDFTQGDWTVWAKWTLATAAASAAAFLLGRGVAVHRIPVDPVIVFLGIFVGAAQWAILRSRLPRAGWWVLATIVGLSTLLFIGVAQWLVVCRYVRQAGWWILTVTLAWFVAIGLGFGIALVLLNRGVLLPGPLFDLIAGSMVGGFGGGLTGIHLVRLLKHPRVPREQEPSPIV